MRCVVKKKTSSTMRCVQEPPNERVAWPAEAAEMFYLKGTCHKEMMNFGEAQDAFNETIRVQPKYAEVRDSHWLQFITEFK